jgi:hypothetical protein
MRNTFAQIEADRLFKQRKTLAVETLHHYPRLTTRKLCHAKVGAGPLRHFMPPLIRALKHDTLDASQAAIAFPGYSQVRRVAGGPAEPGGDYRQDRGKGCA